MANTPWWGTRRRAGALAVVIGAAVLAAGCSVPPPDPSPAIPDPVPEAPAEFTVLTYNVAGLPEGISGSNPERFIPQISPLLNAYDVVLTQEDFDWWTPLAGVLDFRNYHARLRAQAEHPWRTDVHPGPEAVGVNAEARGLLVGDGIGIMAKFPLYDEQIMPWRNCFGGILPPGAGDCLAMKGARMTRMVLADGAEVDVYSLHAEAGGTELDQAYQVENFDDLAAFIERVSAGRAVIVGGDTNLHTNFEHEDGSNGADIVIWDEFLARTGLSDLCVELSCPSVGDIDKFAFRSGGGVELSGVGYDEPRERFRSPQGENLSDHPPVVGTFSWERSAG